MTMARSYPAHGDSNAKSLLLRSGDWAKLRGIPKETANELIRPDTGSLAKETTKNL